MRWRISIARNLARNLERSARTFAYGSTSAGGAADASIGEIAILEELRARGARIGKTPVRVENLRDYLHSDTRDLP